MYTRLLVVVAVWHCAIVQVSCLQCYNCVNCRTVSSDDLVDCAEQLSTTLSATNETATGRLLKTLNLFNVDGLSKEALDGENKQLRADSYYCYSLKTNIYQSTFMIRGCDTKMDDKNLCQLQPTLKECKVCETDKCNGSNTLQLSLFVTFITMAISLASK